MDSELLLVKIRLLLNRRNFVFAGMTKKRTGRIKKRTGMTKKGTGIIKESVEKIFIWEIK